MHKRTEERRARARAGKLGEGVERIDCSNCHQGAARWEDVEHYAECEPSKRTPERVYNITGTEALARLEESCRDSPLIAGLALIAGVMTKHSALQDIGGRALVDQAMRNKPPAVPPNTLPFGGCSFCHAFSGARMTAEGARCNTCGSPVGCPICGGGNEIRETAEGAQCACGYRFGRRDEAGRLVEDGDVPEEDW